MSDKFSYRTSDPLFSKKRHISRANGHEFRYLLKPVPKLGTFGKIAERMSDKFPSPNHISVNSHSKNNWNNGDKLQIEF